MLTGFDHLAIAARDPQKLAAWYARVFGAEIVEWNAAHTAALVRIAARQYLEIMPARDAISAATNEPPAGGFNHLALRVDSLQRAIERLDAIPVCWLTEISPALGGGKMRNLRDDDGNIIQLIER